MYRAMRMARTFEQKLSALYRQGKIVGAVYLGMGQEAIATGVVSLLQKRDYFSTVARGLAGWFMRGVEPKHVHGPMAGQGHSARRTAASSGCFSPISSSTVWRRITTARWRRGFPPARVSRWRSSTAREPRIYAALTGDGATSPGDFYEGLNFAAIHKLPLVVIVENNCFAYSTPTNLQMPVANVADRAPAFNIPAEIGFGNDIFEVRRLARKAIDHARSGNGPYLVEFKTFRQRGHGEHDDMAYVPADLREFWERRDPIRLFQEYLEGEGNVPASEVASIDAECRRVIEEAVPYAEALPAPDPSTVMHGLFAE